MRSAADATKWKALVAAALGWLFDGYESFVLLLVGAIAVRQVLPPDQIADAPASVQSAYGVGILLASAIWLVVAPLGPASWRHMFVIGVVPAFLILYIRRGLHDPALWRAADDRRRAAVARAASGQAVAAEDRA